MGRRTKRENNLIISVIIPNNSVIIHIKQGLTSVFREIINNSDRGRERGCQCLEVNGATGSRSSEGVFSVCSRSSVYIELIIIFLSIPSKNQAPLGFWVIYLILFPKLIIFERTYESSK